MENLFCKGKRGTGGVKKKGCFFGIRREIKKERKGAWLGSPNFLGKSGP